MKISTTYLTPCLLVAAMSVSGCFHEDDSDSMAATMTNSEPSYSITVTNLTNNQVLTPVAVVMHEAGYSAWALGQQASPGLEHLAEAGDVSLFMQEALSNNFVVNTAAGDSVIPPNTSQTVNIRAGHSHSLEISLASMLADTNDAYTGINNWVIGNLDVGESASAMTRVFDAGTEANTESGDSIPGPSSTVGAAGGYSEDTNDGVVTIHPGVVTADDGLSTSALDESKRWLSYAAKVVVTRVE